MNLIVNLQPLLAPLTGIGHYTRELTRALVAGDDRVEGLIGTHIVTLDAEHPLLRTASGTAASNAAPRHDWLRRHLRNAATRYLYRQLMGWQLRRHGARQPRHGRSLYWEPNYVRLPWPGRSAITVHDLSHRRYPEYHPRDRVAFLDRHLAASLARADRIQVVSQFTADELGVLYDVAPNRIDIVSPGVAPRFFSVDEAARRRVRQRHDLPANYCLSVGTLEPRKNLTGLLAAFLDQLPARQRACPLLLVGQRGWGDQTLSPAVHKALDEGRVRLLGYVDDADLPALYAEARLFAYVSRYEGFGMPVIEAMAAGVPVITADRSATREVAADAALTVDPDDREAIRHALERLQDDETLRQSLREGGIRRAVHFTWQRSAANLRASFHQVMSH